MSRWTHSDVIALAEQRCSKCFGLGLRDSRGGRKVPCGCVFRAIFRACHNRFRSIVDAGPTFSASRLREGQRTRRRLATYGFRREEYCADFLAIARRTLDEHEHRIFRWHFLLGADFRLINRKLGRPMSDRGTFHDFYRIEQRLGRAFGEVEPYSLFPLDEYFGGSVRGKRTVTTTLFQVETEEAEAPAQRLRFPIAGAA